MPDAVFEMWLDRCVRSLSTATTDLQETEERFRACTEFVRVHNTIPWPIVAIYRNRELEVFDGYHRLSSLWQFGPQTATSFLSGLHTKIEQNREDR